MDEIAVTAWKDGDVPGVPETLDGAALARWGRLCVAGLGRHRDEINALNVFPVADADTGTNLLATMRAAVAAAEPLAAGSPAHAVAGAMARAGTAGARGNSGIIVSQVLRGLAEAVQDGPLTAATVRIMLRRAAILVREALSTPVDGTMLTVLEAAADRAAEPLAAGSPAHAVAGAMARAMAPATACAGDPAASGSAAASSTVSMVPSTGVLSASRTRIAARRNMIRTVAAVSGPSCTASARPRSTCDTMMPELPRAPAVPARGNSGIIVSQVLRGLAEAVQDGPLTAATVRIMLRRAAILVREAYRGLVPDHVLDTFDLDGRAEMWESRRVRYPGATTVALAAPAISSTPRPPRRQPNRPAPQAHSATPLSAHRPCRSTDT
ncbi:hypothetical protein AWN90_06505 [Nocardia terpenica]|uniref:DhaL domain-containing protein n=1 Tax=Nocardia terpenica TaxID=455432 RepID=A0A164JA51_9NOCA|nr:hypothetical protein AWN90_06505 [Nocardia terpenica]